MPPLGSVESPRIIRVLAFDISTVDTGVVLLAIDPARHMSRAGVVVERQIRLLGIEGKGTLTERFERMRTARRDLSLFVASITCEIDILAFEQPFIRGGDTTAALFQAIGMMLGLSRFDGIPVYEIHTATVKKEQGLSRASFASVDKTIKGAQTAKIRALKLAAVEWGNKRVTLTTPLVAGQDAIPDAIAAGFGAFHKWQDEQYQKEITQAGQGTLNLRRSPQTRKNSK